jgi:hypothetical protein
MSERKVPGQVKQKEQTKIVGVKPEDLGAVPGQRVIRIEYVDLDSLIDHRAERNAKRHRIDELDASMRRHGYAAPIMVDEGTQRIVAGHGRVDTLVTRRAAGREAPDGVHIRDGKWLVPVVRGIAFKDPTEAMSYLLADNQIQMLAGYDWHEMNEIAKIVAESPEGLVGTGFVSMAEIEAQMEREVQGVLGNGDTNENGQLPDDEEPKQKTRTEVFNILVQCNDAEHQHEVLAQLMGMGLNARSVL